MLMVVVLKSLCKESSATTMVMLSHISRFSIIADRSCFIKKEMWTNMLITEFSKLLGFILQCSLKAPIECSILLFF